MQAIVHGPSCPYHACVHLYCSIGMQASKHVLTWSHKGSAIVERLLTGLQATSVEEMAHLALSLVPAWRGLTRGTKVSTWTSKATTLVNQICVKTILSSIGLQQVSMVFVKEMLSTPVQACVLQHDSVGLSYALLLAGFASPCMCILSLSQCDTVQVSTKPSPPLAWVVKNVCKVACR